MWSLQTDFKFLPSQPVTNMIRPSIIIVTYLYISVDWFLIVYYKWLLYSVWIFISCFGFLIILIYFWYKLVWIVLLYYQKVIRYAEVEKEERWDLREADEDFFDYICHASLNNTFHRDFYLNEIALVKRFVIILEGLLDFDLEMRSFYWLASLLVYLYLCNVWKEDLSSFGAATRKKCLASVWNLFQSDSSKVESLFQLIYQALRSLNLLWFPSSKSMILNDIIWYIAWHLYMPIDWILVCYYKWDCFC